MKKQKFIEKIENLGKDVFSVTDVKKLFPEENFLNTILKRFKDAGLIIEVIHGVYALHKKSLDIEKIATRLYYPSYISFESALAKFGIINQGLYKLTLATSRHSKKINILQVECEYSQIKPELFFGFNLIGETYIADPEKAFLDTIYFITLGKRTCNYKEWYLKDLNRNKIRDYLIKYSKSVRKLTEQILSLGQLFHYKKNRI